MDVPQHKIVATKQASGEVLFEIYMGGHGQSILVGMFSMLAADVTSVNTNVNGGSSGATRSFDYTEKSASTLKGSLNGWRANW